MNYGRLRLQNTSITSRWDNYSTYMLSLHHDMTIKFQSLEDIENKEGWGEISSQWSFYHLKNYAGKTYDISPDQIVENAYNGIIVQGVVIDGWFMHPDWYTIISFNKDPLDAIIMEDEV